MSSSEYTSDSELSTSSDEVDYQENNLQLEGKILREYNIITELGRGSYSIVWLGYNIKDKKYYAIKVQHSDDFKSGLDEARFMKRLPKKVDVFNHIIDSFIYTIIEKSRRRRKRIKKKRYLCSVYNLHAGNLDGFLRKGKYKKGYGNDVVKKISTQLLQGLKVLHEKIKVFHGDIKPDNILIKGVNKRDEKLIKLYNKCNYEELLKEELKGNKDKDNFMRKKIHSSIVENIQQKITEEDSIYIIDDKYIEDIKISISDFGDFCDDEEQFDEEFGTRYYRPPEGILMGECDNKVDIWATGCTIYELLTGKILFDPEKDRTRDRDHYHLYYINCYCGNFSKRFLRYTDKWKKYFNKKGELKKFSIKEKSLFSTNFVEKEPLSEFITKLLAINPKKRTSAKDALKLKWLNSNYSLESTR